MNGFIEEVCTQGMLLKRYLKEYWPVDREVVDAIAECFKSKAMNRVILTGMGSSLYAIDAVFCLYSALSIPHHSEMGRNTPYLNWYPPINASANARATNIPAPSPLV